MLSAFSNFLPAAISEKFEKLDLRQQQQQQQQQEEEAVQRKEEAGKKEKKKKSTTNENFIIVRPPPAKTNHPLNLQVQLVPAYTHKNAPDRSNTAQSFSSTTTTDAVPQQPPSPVPSESEPGHTLQRTPSDRSNRSGFYSNSSTSSVISFASSTSTTSSGRRMIIPLYNLHAHNVMTNTILDAGTDARVAKFHRRGLELIGLGVLEPQEVWVPRVGVPHPGEAAPEGITRTTSRNSLAPPPLHISAPTTAAAGSSRAATPDPSQSPSSSHLSLSSERAGGSHTDLPAQYVNAFAQVVVVPATPIAPTSTGAKKLFTKIFRKKREESPAQGERSLERAGTMPSAQVQQQEKAPSPVSPTPSHLSHLSPQAQPPLLLVDSPAATPMHTPQPSHDSHHAHAPHSHPSQGHPPTPLPSILGLTPTLHPTSPSPHPLLSTSPPRSSALRTFKIIWTLKKWLKEPEGEGGPAGLVGMLGKVAAHAQGHGSENGSGGWEVRWEWVRGGEKERRREERRRERRGSAVGQAAPPAAGLGREHSKSVLGEEDGVAVFVESPRGSLDRSRSLGGAQRKQRRRTSLGEGMEDVAGADGEEEDGTEDGYESDPEDSETPWTCSLVVQHVPVQATSGPSRRHSRDVSLSSPAHAHPGSTSSTLSTTSAHAHASTHDIAPTTHPAFPTTKIKIATLSPAPHHPKVVCQLRIPFPLPDVQVSRGAVCKRVVLLDGSTRTTVGTGGNGRGVGVVLTAEEIKDVVCSTACWLVVRESIGGVGKVSRKGDGWRIRG